MVQIPDVVAMAFVRRFQALRLLQCIEAAVCTEKENRLCVRDTKTRELIQIMVDMAVAIC